MSITYVPLDDNDRRIAYTATAGQTVFPYDFLIPDDDDIKVYINGTLKTKTTDYTVSGVGSRNGGNITLVSGATLNDSVLLLGDTARDRQSSFISLGTFGLALDNELKKFLVITQELATKIGRCFQLSTFDESGDNTSVPTGTRANKVLGFGSNGDLIATQELGSWAGNWATATYFTERDFVNQNGSLYICLESHTSGTFATDLAAGKWELILDGSAIVVGDSTITEAKLSLSDVTTWNATSLLHGFLKKLSGIAGQFMDGTGNWAVPTAVAAHATTHKSGGSDAIKLDELAAPTDVTTLDATTLAHGLLKKLSGVPSQFLDGVGNFAVPTPVLAASAAEQVTGNETAKYVAPGTQRYHESSVKLWANITNSGTPAIADDYGVASVADTAQGVTTVTFDSNFANTDYACSGAVNATGAYKSPYFTSQAIASVVVTTRDASDNNVDVGFSMMACGTLA